MTASRAPAEPAVREFESTVERVDGREVVLEETYFYAESGGQPADRGTLAGVLVDDVTERDGEVVHVLGEDPTAGGAGDVEPGEVVTGVIDDDFRTYCARAHTASHVLYGAARRTCEDLGYAGFDISPEKVRVDLTTAEPLDDEDLVELERLSNRAVWESRSVSWEVLPEAAARDRDGIAFNTKTEEGAMSGGESVRVVTVEDWDVAACGGTHVENTAEIGTITALDRSNPGEGVTRVEFAVGPTAIDRVAARHAAALEAATAADTNVEDLPDEVRRLRGEVDRLDSALRDAQSDLLGARLAEFPTSEVDGVVWAVGTVADADPNDLREPAKALLESEADVDALAAVGTGSAPFVVAAAVPDADADAGEVVGAVTDEFGGGGGGGPTFAQGGGLDADPESVVDWLRSR
ncbi:alanyl-tRNA synthetase [Halorubrum aquaticum]|uniref:Alanine--tRNA ligase n=1 Tax=Halorubrum aquaticum TaxID=387340 RepID=A0A1I2ZTQ2_9EURY|nr:DHHA1 domain-containing protein [Halorubrum aquaticum]SFH41237.1 alanyl-tRNA synthetase [Halorubrum aquaticum]